MESRIKSSEGHFGQILSKFYKTESSLRGNDWSRWCHKVLKYCCWVVSRFCHYLSLLTFTRSTVPVLKGILLRTRCLQLVQGILLNVQFHRWTSSTSKSTHKPPHDMAWQRPLMFWCFANRKVTSHPSQQTVITGTLNSLHKDSPSPVRSHFKGRFQWLHGGDGKQKIVTVLLCGATLSSLT